MNKITISVISVLIAAAIVGAYFFPQVTRIERFGSTSPANSTNVNQNQLLINGWNLANSTSTSVLNNTGFDISATQLQYTCAGVGTSVTAYTGAGLTNAGLTLKAATTSTSMVGSTATSNTGVTNTNLIVSTTIATSSANTLVASSTPAIAGNSALNDVIPNGSYVTFFTNATNTAVCNIGVQIL